VYLGHLPTAAPMPARSVIAVADSEVELEAVGARVFGALHDVVPTSRFDSTMSDAITACFG
jgi:hypothetical protein